MLPNFSQDADAHGAVMEAKTALLHPLTNPGLAADFCTSAIATRGDPTCRRVLPELGRCDTRASRRFACSAHPRASLPSGRTLTACTAYRPVANYWLPPARLRLRQHWGSGRERDVGSARESVAFDIALQPAPFRPRLERRLARIRPTPTIKAHLARPTLS